MNKIILIIAIIGLFLVSGCQNKKQIGGDKDEHGCLIAAGYTWCEPKQKCLRTWEEECLSEDEKISLEEAIEIANESECIEKGTLTNTSFYNNYTKTWWIDLEMKEEFKLDYCNPACVINEKTKTAEINWRCTGALP